jgi:protein-tyrosine phosphatase
MVCLGNICRSPLAEGIIKKHLRQTGMQAYVDSAGLIGYHIGELPDKRSIAVAAHYGIDITDQRARMFVKSDLQKFDYIFAMDQNNFENLQEYAVTTDEQSRIHLLLEFAGLGKKAVPDPYYGDKSDFEHVYQLLDDACQKIVHKLSVKSSVKIA